MQGGEANKKSQGKKTFYAPAPSSPTFLISATLNVSPALPSSAIAPTRVTSPPPALSAKKIATELTEENFATLSACGVPSLAASALSSNSAVAGSDSASEKPSEGLLTKTRTFRGAASASGALIEMEVSLTAGEREFCRCRCCCWFRRGVREQNGQREGGGERRAAEIVLLSLLLSFTLRERDVDQQLLVRVRLEEQARVLAVALRWLFWWIFVSRFVERVEVEEEEGAMGRSHRSIQLFPFHLVVF